VIQVIKNQIYVLSIRAILFLMTLFFIFYYFNIQWLIKNTLPKEYLVVAKSCGNGNQGSTIWILHNGGKYSLSYDKNKCKTVQINSKITLYHSDTYDYFYIPNTLWLYKRYILFCGILFLLSFIPYLKFKKYLYNNLGK